MSSVMKTPRVSVNCVNPGIIKSGALAMSRWMDRVPEYLSRNIPSPEAGVIPTLRALESNDTGYIFSGADKQVKTTSMLKNREMFIRVCNDTMRILKEHLNQQQ
jgi:short-subunit dehydrogenase